jgi:ActR/RegA family two-component response regulator
MNKRRVLLARPDDDIRAKFREGLEACGFEVFSASSVSAALGLISIQKFDVLVSGLHLPNPGDGFTVVNAMRHTHPAAVIVVVSGHPAIREAMSTIDLQADAVLINPSSSAMIESVQEMLSNPSVRIVVNKERVAGILERDAGPTIKTWLSKVELDAELTVVRLSAVERAGHLELILEDLVRRLRRTPEGGGKAFASSAAREHGVLRRMQGYTVPMMVEESRILQVCIFNTLQKNLGRIDFDTVFLDVMTIADEVDSQLKQAVLGFSEPLVGLSASQHT